MPRSPVPTEERAPGWFVGRAAELAELETCIEAGSPRVLHVSGVAGIGKSSLLDTLVARVRHGGAAVVRLDCRTIEPSEPALLAALAGATGASAPTLEVIGLRLDELAPNVFLVLDTYERFWLMDTFIRRELCPALGTNVVLILAGRNAPVSAWVSSPEWAERFRSIVLGPLTERESLSYLHGRGLDDASARRINAITRGHPLALSVAAGLGTGTHGRRLEDVAVGAVVDHLTGEYLADATDPQTREALEAASVLRRATESLLRRMLPGSAPSDLMDRLRNLPFVESVSDGLLIHDAVRDAVSTALQASDPERHRTYRVAAWRQLREEVAHATPATLWRYTADILYLLREPVVREGFFPSGYQAQSVEPAQATDGPAIEAIAKAHEGPEGVSIVQAWWQRHPEAFRVCRGLGPSIDGFFIVAAGNQISEDIIAADPVAACWWGEMREANSPGKSLLLRRLLDFDEGEANSASRSAFGLDVKRTYMELRPNLRYIYIAGVRPENFDWCDPLGFELVPGATRVIDGTAVATRRLDMGPGSVDAWLAGLVAKELGISAESSQRSLFDAETRELVLPSGRVSLTPLEFGVMKALQAKMGRPVSRADLMECVWGYDSSTSSNVVEAVVLALRKKLGSEAAVLETVRGTGYRLRDTNR